MCASLQVLISDLDGALLEQGTRSFSAAVPALRELREREIPVVFRTRKTFEETVETRRDLGVSAPLTRTANGIGSAGGTEVVSDMLSELDLSHEG